MDLLTVREAESIIDMIPEVASARRSGECPQYSVTFVEANKLWIQVRSGCGSGAGELIDNYTVDRVTGVAMTSVTRSTRVLDAAGRAYAARVAEQAHTRRLSPEDARCLANLALREDFSGQEDPDATVEVLGKEEFGRLRFTAVSHFPAQPVQIARTLSVDLGSGLVRDDDTGVAVSSGILGSVVQKMLLIRRPASLSEHDALLVALATPQVQQRTANGCVLTGGGATSARELFGGFSCNGQSRGPVISIDLQSGKVIDTDNHRVLDSPASLGLAAHLFQLNKEEEFKLAEQIRAVCRGSH